MSKSPPDYSKHYYLVGAICIILGIVCLYQGHSASLDEAYQNGLSECHRTTVDAHEKFARMEVPEPHEGDDPILYSEKLVEFWIRAHVGCTGDFIEKIKMLVAEYRKNPGGTIGHNSALLGMYAVAMHSRAACEP